MVFMLLSAYIHLFHFSIGNPGFLCFCAWSHFWFSGVATYGLVSSSLRVVIKR